MKELATIKAQRKEVLYTAPLLSRPQRPRSISNPGKASIDLCIEISLESGILVARQIVEERENSIIYIGQSETKAAEEAIKAFALAKESGWIDKVPGQSGISREEVLSALAF